MITRLQRAISPNGSGPPPRRAVAVITLAYAFFASLWIAASDSLLGMLVEDPALRAQIGSAKGFVYVAVTSMLLYLLLDRWRPWSQAPEDTPSERKRLAYLLPAFLGLALVVPVVAVAVVRVHGQQVEAEAYSGLLAVADLKSRQIQSWLAERDGDGRALALSSGFALLVARWRDTGATEERELVQDRLNALQTAIQYEGVALLDADGQPLLAAGVREEVPAALRPLMAKALISGEVLRSDLYLDESGKLHLDWIAPIRSPLAADRKVIAFVLLHVEPQRVLFPLIQSWHGPSPTAESFLIRREGDAVVYLNRLRHRAGPPLSLRLPVTTHELPAAASILGGERRTLPGIDYRGVAVLAAVQPVAGTAWHLVAKVDRDEVMTPLRALAWWVSLVALCAIATVAALILMLWRLQRRADQLAARAQAAEQIREFNQQLENRVAERTAQLAAANRELESFAYAASHDLKAPLRGIAGYSRLLESECRGQLDAEGQGFVTNIRQAAMQMHQLIDDLLAYSRVERGALRPVPTALPALVQAVVAECRPDLDLAGAVVSVDLPELIVTVDYDGMVIALRNLLDNALKFSRHARPPRIDIGGRVDARCAVIWVRDNGIGFDMKFHDRIFEIFNRLESSSEYPGTGVGLALVRKAMQRMGGRVWAEGKSSGGATFFVELPLPLPTT